MPDEFATDKLTGNSFDDKNRQNGFIIEKKPYLCRPENRNKKQYIKHYGNEKNIPTIEHKTQKQAWIPRTYGNG